MRRRITQIALLALIALGVSFGASDGYGLLPSLAAFMLGWVVAFPALVALVKVSGIWPDFTEKD